MTGAAQGDGTNEHGKHGRTIFQEEIALPCLVDIISEDDIGMKTLSQSEKYRFVTCLGRVKETTSNLRKLHARLKPTYTKIMESEDFVFALTGDLKYLLTMNGNLGASSTCPCPVCVRKRRNLVTAQRTLYSLLSLHTQGRRGYVDSELKQIKQDKEAFRNTINEIGGKIKTQLRAYPADPHRKHNCKANTCFCMGKCAEYLQEMIEDEFEDDIADGWIVTDQKAPFHDRVLELSRTCTHSQIAMPLMELVPLILRLPGIWHCIHNCRGAMWVLMKDAAARYKVIDALKQAMIEIDLPNIKCAASARPRKKGLGFSQDDGQVGEMLDVESAEAARVVALTEEERNQGIERTSMDGVELTRCLVNFPTLADAMIAAVPTAQKERIKRWRVSMEKAITAFNRGAAIALADIWHIDKSAEMGEAFREWFDTMIDGLGPECGLPYLGREYVNILPAHWLAEPDHLQQFASQLWQEHGVSPGSGSDAVMEMVIRALDLFEFCGLRASVFHA